MEEEVLENIYNHLKGNNLTESSYDDWKSNFSSNSEVRKNVHGYLSENNLTKSDYNSWEENIGLKKKDNSEPISQGSQSESLVQQVEQQPTLDTDVQKETEVSDGLGGQQSNVVELSDEEVGIESGTMIPLDSRVKKGDIDLTEARSWLDYNTTLSDEEEKEIEDEYEMDRNNEGFFNIISSVAKMAWNKTAGLLPALKTEIHPLADKVNEAKEELSKAGVEINQSSLSEKTKELYLKEKRGDLIQSKTNQALQDLPVEIKDKLEIKTSDDYKNVAISRVETANSIKINSVKISEGINRLDELKDNIETQEQVDDYNSLVRETNELIENQKVLQDKYSSDIESMTNLEEEVDNLKRSYSSWDNFSGKFSTSGARMLGQGYLGLVDWVNDVRKGIMGDDGLTYTFGATLPIPTQAYTNKSKEIEDWAVAKEDGLRKQVKDINGVGDLIDATVDVTATQIPNMLPFLFGGGIGVAATGVSALGQKNVEMKGGDKKYSDTQLVVAPLISGVSTSLLGAIPTARVLSRGKGIFKEAIKTEGGRIMLAKSKAKVIEDLTKKWGKSMIEEIPTEILDQVVQNSIDIDILDNPNNIKRTEGLDMVLRDTAIFTTLLSVAPMVAGGLAKKVTPKKTSERLNKNAVDIVKLRDQLQFTEDPVLIKDIEGRIQVKLEDNKNIYEKAVSTVRDTDPKLMDKAISNESRMTEIAGIAKSIEKSNLSKEAKAERLSELKVEFDNLANFNDDVFLGNKTVLDALGDKELLKLKDKAEKELTKEALDSGKENFEINDKQISERALQIYNEKQEVVKLKKEVENEEAIRENGEIESEGGETEAVDTEQGSETEVAQEEGETELTVKDIENMDLSNDESKSKVIDFLDKASETLKSVDESLKKHGQENLSMGLPIVASRVAVKAMRASIEVAKTGAEVIQAGIDAVKNSKWYENLDADKKKEFDDNAYSIVSDNVTKEVGKQVKKARESKEFKEVERKREVAKTNIKKGKIGDIRGDFSAYVDLVSIPLSSVPKHVVEKYKSLIDELGKRKKVLRIENDTQNLKDIKEVIDAVELENNKIKPLFLTFSEYMQNNEDLTVNQAIKQMVKDGIISDEEAEVMSSRKDVFKKDRGERKPLENRESVKGGVISLINKVKSNKNNSLREVSNLRKLKSAKEEDIDSLSDTELIYLNEAMSDYDNRGKMPLVVQQIINSIESNQRKRVMVSAVKSIKVPWYALSAKIKTSLKGFVGKDIDVHKQRIIEADLAEIDQSLGKMMDTKVFKTVFSKMAKMKSAYDAKVDDIVMRVEAVRDNTGKTENDKIISGAKITMYMLAKQRASNPHLNPVSDHINATHSMSSTKHIDGDTKDMIKDVSDGFLVVKEDGMEDVDAMYNQLTPNEKNAVKVLRKVLDDQAETAYQTRLYDDGNATPFIEDYYPINSIDSDYNGDLEKKMKNTSFRSDNLKYDREIGSKAKALSFNPYNTILNAARGTYFQDSFLQENRVVSKMFDNIDKDTSISREDRTIISQIADVYRSQVDSMTNQSIGATNGSVLGSFLHFVKKQAYRVMLGKSVRATSELISNVFGATIAHGEVFGRGVEDITEVRGNDSPSKSNESLRKVLINLGVSQVDRFSNPSVEHSGRTDSSLSKAKKNIGGSNLESKFKSTIKAIEGNIVARKYSGLVAKYHDLLITAPDMVVSMPVLFGRISQNFEKVTGKKIDWKKIESNDREYFDKYHKVISESTDIGNRAVKQMASSKNTFESSFADGTNQDSMVGLYNEFNGFFRSFMKTEFTTLAQSTHDLFNKGEMTKVEAGRMMTAIIVRQITYGIAIKKMGAAIYGGLASLLGYDDEENDSGNEVDMDIFRELTGDDELSNLMEDVFKNLKESNKGKKKSDGKDDYEVTKALLSTGASMLIGKRGNTVGYTVNQLLEQLNYAYGEGITRDEGSGYDPFKDGVFNAKFRADKKTSKSEAYRIFTKTLLASRSPFAEAAIDMNMFGLAATMGAIPSAGDIKGVANKLKYDIKGGDKSTLVMLVSATIPDVYETFTKAEVKKLSRSEKVKLYQKDLNIPKKDAEDMVDTMDKMMGKLK